MWDGSLFCDSGTSDRDFSRNAYITSYFRVCRWSSVGETLKMVLITISSIQAHKVTYRILENIRCQLTEKMLHVPMGVMIDTPSGKLKAVVIDTVEKLEQPLAHMLPEITANVFTPICIIVLLFVLDWRMGLACMAVIPLGFILLMGQMKDYKNRSQRYIEASGGMDSALVLWMIYT